jgi:hypothetical protein
MSQERNLYRRVCLVVISGDPLVERAKLRVPTPDAEPDGRSPGGRGRGQQACSEQGTETQGAGVTRALPRIAIPPISDALGAFASTR